MGSSYTNFRQSGASAEPSAPQLATLEARGAGTDLQWNTVIDHASGSGGFIHELSWASGSVEPQRSTRARLSIDGETAAVFLGEAAGALYRSLSSRDGVLSRNSLVGPLRFEHSFHFEVAHEDVTGWIVRGAVAYSLDQ